MPEPTPDLRRELAIEYYSASPERMGRLLDRMEDAEASLVEFRRSAPAHDPLRILDVNEMCSRADDEPVTVEGEVRRIEHRQNEAGAPMVTLTLADLNNDEITAKVDLYPAVYAAVVEERQQAGLPPLAVGDHILARGATACRTSLDAYAVHVVTDRDGDTDPAVYTTNPPSYAAPPFTPSRSSQFLAGLRNGCQWGGAR